MSSPPCDRTALLTALNREVRWVSAHSVLFSHLMAERAGVRSTDLEAVDILDLAGPMTAGRLAEMTGLTTGAATTLIDRLEAAGYVRREPDPRDRRRVIVRPLPWPEQMTQMVRPAFDMMAKGFEDLCGQYSEAELSLVLDFLTRTNAVAQETIAQVRRAMLSADQS